MFRKWLSKVRHRSTFEFANNLTFYFLLNFHNSHCFVNNSFIKRRRKPFSGYDFNWWVSIVSLSVEVSTWGGKKNRQNCHKNRVKRKVLIKTLIRSSISQYQTLHQHYNTIFSDQPKTIPSESLFMMISFTGAGADVKWLFSDDNNQGL